MIDVARAKDELSAEHEKVEAKALALRCLGRRDTEQVVGDLGPHENTSL